MEHKCDICEKFFDVVNKPILDNAPKFPDICDECWEWYRKFNFHYLKEKI